MFFTASTLARLSDPGLTVVVTLGISIKVCYFNAFTSFLAEVCYFLGDLTDVLGFMVAFLGLL
jgi:hypothetical protein